MNRTTIRSTLSAIAALALVSAFEAARPRPKADIGTHYRLGDADNFFPSQAEGAAQPEGARREESIPSAPGRNLPVQTYEKQLSLTDDQ